MANQERIENLENAQEKIHEAIELIEAAVSGTNIERNTQAYIIAHLRGWADGDNPHDDSIPKLIEQFQGGSEYNLSWFRNDQVVGEETSEFDNDDDAYQYAELQANNQYDADDFEAIPNERG